MKKIIYLIIAGLFFSISAKSQVLVNNGANIKINNGSSLVIEGDFRNESNGAIGNSGLILITGNWTNNATSGNLLQGTTGTVRFNGTSPQGIAGTTRTWFSNVRLLNDAYLGVLTSVSGLLDFNSTYLSLGANNLIMLNGSTITGSGPTGYVVAGSSGQLVQWVTGSNKGFPVGTTSNYVPVVLNNSGTNDYYGVNVFQDVRTNGLTGGTIPEINDCVDMTWNITEQAPGGSNLSVTPYWTAGLEGSNFSRAHCAVGHFTAGTWDPDNEGSASGINPFYITRTGITSLSAFAVGDLESPMAIPVDIRLDLTAFLEGPFNGTGMDDDLNSAGIIPLNQPYNTPPWNYPGSESVPSVPSNVVDWFLLDLRDATSAATATSATSVAMKAVFVLNDGSVVDLDGSSLPDFSFTLTNQLFVVVWHRNHLGIMSANPLVKIGGIYTYDFTVSAGQAYLGGQKNLGGGNYGMYAGNADGDQTVDALDYSVWRSNAGLMSYDGADFNMNSQINNQDKDDFWYFNQGISSTVP